MRGTILSSVFGLRWALVALFALSAVSLAPVSCGGTAVNESASQEDETEDIIATDTTVSMTNMSQGSQEMQGMTMETVDPSTAGVNVDFNSDPANPQPNQSVALRYLVSDADSGQVLTNLPIEMEKPMHLIIVSQDLSEFQHIHPTVGNDGAYTVTTTLPEAATYVLFDQFMYNGQTVLDRRELTVGEASEKSASLSPDLSPKTENGLTVTVSAPETVKAGEDEHFNLRVTRDGQPVTDLEPYLGTAAHILIISSDIRDYGHVHGELGGMDSMDSPPSTFGPEVGFHYTFPHSGLYKMWTQFGYQGSVITVPYVVEVV